MKQTLSALICLFLLSAPSAHADLSLSGRSTVLAMGMQGVGQEGLWLRKTKLRRDLIDRGKAYTHLYDLATREITIVDHSQRLASIFAMSALNQDADARFASKDLKLDLNPTGRRHQLQGWNCQEFKLLAAMPAEVAGEKVSFELEGTIWLAKNSPEQTETAAFVKAAQEPDFFMGIPVLAKKSPSQAKGMSEVVRRLAPLGLLCAVDVDTRYQGSGRMAELSRKMASHIAVTYERYTTDLVKDEVFEIPRGYRVVRQ
ncbi:MAG: hypothetical protein AB1899_01950 [Pseudomonadota bacterium]